MSYNYYTPIFLSLRNAKFYQIPFHIIDDEGNIPNIYFSPSIPTTFIINKEGNIIRKSFGAEDWDDATFIDELRKLL